VACLSTPIAYITSTILVDPFTPEHSRFVSDPEWKKTYWYATIDGVWGAYGPDPNWRPKIWCVHSYGPDRVQGVSYDSPPAWEQGLMRFPYYWIHEPTLDRAVALNMVYDPTNGTNSAGDIGRFGGETAGMPYVVGGK